MDLAAACACRPSSRARLKAAASIHLRAERPRAIRRAAAGLQRLHRRPSSPPARGMPPSPDLAVLASYRAGGNGVPTAKGFSAEFSPSKGRGPSPYPATRLGRPGAPLSGLKRF